MFCFISIKVIPGWAIHQYQSDIYRNAPLTQDLNANLLLKNLQKFIHRPIQKLLLLTVRQKVKVIFSIYLLY